MSLSQPYESARHRLRNARCCAEALEHAGEAEASVKAPAEFGKVTVQVLGPDRVMALAPARDLAPAEAPQAVQSRRRGRARWSA